MKVAYLTSTGGRKFDSAGGTHKGVATIGRILEAYPHPCCHSFARGCALAHSIVKKFGPRHEFIDQDVGDEIGCTGVVLVHGRTRKANFLGHLRYRELRGAGALDDRCSRGEERVATQLPVLEHGGGGNLRHLAIVPVRTKPRVMR